MSKRCENHIKRAIAADRERIAKLVCPLCKHGIPLHGDVHPIKVEEGETTGTWLECMAKEIRNPSPQPESPPDAASNGEKNG